MMALHDRMCYVKVKYKKMFVRRGEVMVEVLYMRQKGGSTINNPLLPTLPLPKESTRCCGRGGSTFSIYMFGNGVIKASV